MGLKSYFAVRKNGGRPIQDNANLHRVSKCVVLN